MKKKEECFRAGFLELQSKTADIVERGIKWRSITSKHRLIETHIKLR